MKPTNILLYFIIFVLGGCIKPFTPELKDSSIGKYVVEGTISSNEEWHQVIVSKTSSVSRESFIPVDGCQVTIQDTEGNSFETTDFGNGVYKAYIPSNYLSAGHGFKVLITTPKGEKIESDFDVMPETTAIENIYHRVENQTDLVTGDLHSGVQFYASLAANKGDKPYLRWKLIETWEYHSAYPIEHYFDGHVQQVVPPDYSEFYCWTTDQVDQIFTINTSHLSSDQIEKIPLHFVENTTSRLGVLYSLLINQMSLSYESYIYWEQLRINSSVQGDLYPSQPLAIKGNMHFVDNEDIEVLGFFQAVGVATHRIFVYPPENLEMNFSDWCDPVLMEHGFGEIKPRDYPGYLLTIDGDWTMFLMNDECVLCTSRGGTTLMPDFWPSKTPMP